MDNSFYIIIFLVLCIMYYVLGDSEKFQNDCKIPKDSIQGTGNVYTGLMCIDDTLPIVSLSDDQTTFSCVTSKNNSRCLTRSDLNIPNTVQCKDPTVYKFKDWIPNTQYNVNDTVYYDYKTYVDDINKQIMDTQILVATKTQALKDTIVTQQQILDDLKLKLSNKIYEPLSQGEILTKIDLDTNQIPTIITDLATAKNEYAKDTKNKILKNAYDILAKTLSMTRAKSISITPINKLNKQINDQKTTIANLNNLLKYPDRNSHPNDNDIDELKTKLNQLPSPNNFVCIKSHVSPNSFGSTFDSTLWKVAINVNTWLSGPGLRDISGSTRLIFNDLSSNGYYKQECNPSALNDTNHWCNKVYTSYQNYCSKQNQRLGNGNVPGCDLVDFDTKKVTLGPLSSFKSTTSTAPPVKNTFYGKLPQNTIDQNTINGTPDAYTVNTCLRQCTIDPQFKNALDACKTSCMCCGLKTNCPASSINSGSGCCMQAKLI